MKVDTRKILAKLETLPFNCLSLFRGCSVCLIIMLLLIATGGLFWVNHEEMYPGSGNNCLGKNTIAMYGLDNFVYCPNTFYVSSLNITDLYLHLAVQTFEGVDESYFQNGINETLWNFQDIYIDYSGKSYWYFNFNPGASLELQFVNITSPSLSLVVDDDDIVKEIPTGDSTATVYPNKHQDLTRGYKVQLISKNKTDFQNYVGYVNLTYNQINYGDEHTISNYTCKRGFNCTWNFDFGEKICLSMYYMTDRNWNRETAGYCLNMGQVGYDQEWTLFLLTSCSLTILLILIVNGFIGCIYRDLEKQKKVNHILLNDDLSS